MKIFSASLKLFIFLHFQNAIAACQPQCVEHARHSVKIFSHRVGEIKGAIDWFNLAKKHGDTVLQPGAGIIRLPLVIPPQAGVNLVYGHVIFVKTSTEIIKDKKYLLNISQTNHDGRCSHELATAYFYPKTMKMEFIDGYFNGSSFSVAGFIKR